MPEYTNSIEAEKQKFKDILGNFEKFSNISWYNNRDSYSAALRPGCTENMKEADNMFQNKVAVITGGAQGIGKCIAEEFMKNGASVCIIDKQPNDCFIGDLAEEETLVRFVDKVIAEHGKVDYLINNALPLMKGISQCSYEEFNYALRVGVTAPFYLTKLFLPHFAPDAAIVNISSSRDRMSQPQTESYTAAKAAFRPLLMPWRSVLEERSASTLSPLAGSIPLIQSIQARMPHSILPAGWEILWILPTWYCISAPIRPVLSQEKTSALTAA